MIPSRSMFEYRTRGCSWGGKGGSKRRHIPTDSDRRSVEKGPVVGLEEPRRHPKHVLQFWSPVWVNGQYSEEFELGVGVHQGSVLGHCSSYRCRKRVHTSSTLMYHGNSFRLITWCSLRTPRSFSPNSGHGMLAWTVKASMSTWRRPSSWSLVLAFMSSSNHTIIPVVSAVGVLVRTPSSTHSASCGFARGATASLVVWWLTPTTSAQVVKARLDPWAVDKWLKCMSMAPNLIWWPLSATWVTCCAPVGAETMPLLPAVVWPGESLGNFCLSSPPGACHLRCAARCV